MDTLIRFHFINWNNTVETEYDRELAHTARAIGKGVLGQLTL
jgi:hypothetical protein